MLRILLVVAFSVGFGITASYLSSPLGWYNMIKYKTIWRSSEHNGINEKKFSSAKTFVGFNLFILCYTAFICFLIYLCSARISVFCGGTLAGIICFVAFKIIQQNYYYAEPNKKVKKLLLTLLVIYIIGFVYDNVKFSRADVENITQIELSKENLPDEFTFSGNDFINLAKTSFSPQDFTLYCANGKMINCPGSNYVILFENDSASFIGFKSFSKICTTVPESLVFKNPAFLGVVADDGNTIHFVYALLSKKTFFSPYKVDKYALYNTEKQETAYYETLPDFVTK